MNNEIMFDKKKTTQFLLGWAMVIAVTTIILGILLNLSSLSTGSSFLIALIYCLLLFSFIQLTDFLNYWLKIKNWILRAIISSLGFTISSLIFQVSIGGLWYLCFITGFLLLILCLAKESEYKNKCRSNPYKFLLISDEAK